MDGDLAVYYQGHLLAARPAPSEAPLLRVRNMARVIPGMLDSDEPALPVSTAKKASQPKLPHHTKPSPDHPWRRPFKGAYQ